MIKNFISFFSLLQDAVTFINQSSYIAKHKRIHEIQSKINDKKGFDTIAELDLFVGDDVGEFDGEIDDERLGNVPSAANKLVVNSPA